MHFVFIDLSYLLFHRYYAVIAWARMSKNDIDINSPIFLEKFSNGFDTFLIKLKKKLGLLNFKNVFFVKDTCRSNIWRNKIYDQYKNNRNEKKYDFDPTIFAYAQDHIIPDLSKKNGIKTLQVDTAEADDIIAVGCEVVRNKYKTSVITVVSNDNDFVQLYKINVSVINANFVNIVERFDEEQLSVYILWKVIKGDKSDNIPSIDKKIGDKIALKLAKNPDLLKKKLESSELVADQFKTNSRLIDFTNIPKCLKDTISNLLEKMI